MKEWLLRHFAKKDKQLFIFLKQRDCTHDWVRTSIHSDLGQPPRTILARIARCVRCQYALTIPNYETLPKTGLLPVETWETLK